MAALPGRSGAGGILNSDATWAREKRPAVMQHRPQGLTRVTVLDDYQSVAHSMAGWRDTGHELEVAFVPTHIADDAGLLDLLKDTDIVVAMRERTPLRAGLIARLPRLELIVTTGMQNASIDMDAGPMVCGTPSLTSPTAELTWALITGLMRNVPAEAASLRAGTWQSPGAGLGEGLEGSTLAILGLGRLGSRVAAIGRAFGMQVIAWSQNLTEETARAHGVERVSKAELFRRADVLSIHLRLSGRTESLVGEPELRSMKPTARLINTSRAGIVDQAALLQALHRGGIAGAGLDVFDAEPLPAGHPLLSAPNTLLTPHLGYVTRQNYEVFYGGAVEAITGYLNGAPVRVLASGTRAAHG